MNKGKWKNICLSGILAAALTGAGLIPAFAAGAVDISQTGTVAVGLGQSGYGEELKDAGIETRLYRVADVDAGGAFTPTQSFEGAGLDFSGLENAQALEAMAETADTWVKTQEQSGGQIQPDGIVYVEEGQGQVTGLPLGLYLLATDPVTAGEHSYTFAPSLVPVPQWDGSGEDWVYSLSVVLKPEQGPLYGSLKILKTLDTFNASLGNATFVFQIEGRDQEGNIVYSNVAATTHTGAGIQEVVVENIPAGTVVTVTEVYSGASYTLTSQASQTAVIKGGEQAETAFSNTYTNELVPGCGAVNQFEYNENSGWQWSRQER